MDLTFSVEGASCAWFMLCGTGAQWPREKWLEAETGVEIHQDQLLAKWCEKHLIQTKEKSMDPEKREFLAGTYPLKKVLVDRLKEHLKHYRKQKAGMMRPVHFADLEMTLNGRTTPTAEDAEQDPVPEPVKT